MAHIIIKKDRTKKSFLTELADKKILYLMVLPTVVTIVLFRYLPMFGIVMAFQRFNFAKGFFGSPWADKYGFEHFIDFFTRNPNAHLIIFNTIAIAVIKLLVTAFPPLMLAIIFNEVRNKTVKKVAQTVSYIPHFVSWIVITGLIYAFFLQTEDAPVNSILINMGILNGPYNFLNNQISLWTILVLSDVWKGVGWGSIMYLAIITGIDPQLYEAIDMDGGGRWVKIRYITWPAVIPTFIILFILSFGRIMTGGGSTFDQLYVLGNAFNRPYADIIGTYVYRVGFTEGRFSFAAAVGLLQSVTNLILLITANWVAKKTRGSGLF